MKGRSAKRWPALLSMTVVGLGIGVAIGYSLNNINQRPIPISTSPVAVTPAPTADKPKLTVFIPKPVPPVTLTDSVTGLTADEAVEMGNEKFVERYSARSKDDSLAGVSKANSAYIRLREAKNAAVLSTIDPKYVENAKKADQLLHTMYQHHVLMAQCMAGGGTMYGQISISEDATRADRVGEIFMALRDPKPDSSLRSQAKGDLKQMDKLSREFLDGDNIAEYFSDMSEPANMGDEAYDTKWQDIYRKELKIVRRAVAQMRPLCKALPDRAARLLAAAAADALVEDEETETGEAEEVE